MFISLSDIKVFTKFTITFILVIVIILVSLLPIYISLYNSVLNNQIQNASAFTERQFNAFSNTTENLLLSIMSLNEDPDIMQLSYTDIGPHENFYVAYKAQKKIQSYFFYNDIIDMSAVFLPKKDLVITSSHIFFKTQDFFDHFNISRDSPEYSFYESDSSGIFTDSPGVVNSARTINFKYSLLRFPGNNINMNMIISFNHDKVMSGLLEESAKDYCFAYLANSDNAIIGVYNYSDVLPLDIAQDAKDIMLNGERYLLSSFEGFNGIKLVTGMNISYFSDIYLQTRAIIYRYIAIAFVIGIIISMVLARRQSLPIGNTLDVIRSLNIETPKQSELKTIETAIISISEKRNELDSIVKINLLEKLFVYGVYSASSINLCSQYFPGIPDEYIVVLLSMYDENHEYSDFSAQERNEGKLIMQQLISDEFSPDTLHYPDVSNSVYALLPVYPDIEDRVKRMVGNFSGHPFIIKAGISAQNTGIENIAKSSAVAKSVLTAGYHNKNEFVFTSNSSESRILINTKLLDKLENMVNLSKVDEVTLIIEDIFEQIENSNPSTTDLQQVFFSIRGIYSNVLSRLTLANSAISYSLPAELKEYSIPSVIREIYSINSDICELVKEASTKRASALNNDIIAYIRDHYTDANLCASSIADHFLLSEKYIFRLVKEATGQTLNEYMLSLRLDAAMSLLENTDKSAAMISAAVGFNSYNTFYKVFVREIGCSPTIYKKNNNS